MDLIVEPVAKVLLTVTPDKSTRPLHLIVLQSTLVDGLIGEGIFPLAMLDTNFERASVGAAIEVCLSAFSVQSPINFDSVLTGSLPGN